MDARTFRTSSYPCGRSRLRHAACRGARSRGPVDAKGVRIAPVSGRPPEQSALTPRAPAGRVGARLRRSGRLSQSLCQPVAQEDRSESFESHLPPDGAMGGLPSAALEQPVLKTSGKSSPEILMADL